MLENCLHTTERLNHIRAIRVQIPQLSIMPLAGPPERIALHVLINLEFGPRPETLIEAQCTAVFLEQSVDTRQAAVPAIFKIL